jgi:hypothetical protein
MGASVATVIVRTEVLRAHKVTLGASSFRLPNQLGVTEGGNEQLVSSRDVQKVPGSLVASA